MVRTVLHSRRWWPYLWLVVLVIGCAPAGPDLAGTPVVASSTPPHLTETVGPSPTPTPVSLATSTVALASMTPEAAAATETTPRPPTALPSTATPTATPAPTLVYGRTDEGVYFYGYPDAPVTVIDYSDYL